jgi:hypothetical protein
MSQNYRAKARSPPHGRVSLTVPQSLTTFHSNERLTMKITTIAQAKEALAGLTQKLEDLNAEEAGLKRSLAQLQKRRAKILGTTHEAKAVAKPKVAKLYSKAAVLKVLQNDPGTLYSADDVAQNLFVEGPSKAGIHRLLQGLAKEGKATHDKVSNTYFVKA